MKEQLINYNTAALAKAKGFNVPCKHRFFTGEGELEEQVTHDRKTLRILEVSMRHFRKTEVDYFLRPTQSLLQKWLREVHNIDIHCYPDYRTISNKKQKVYDCMCVICKTDAPKMILHINDFLTFEDALEQGLYQMLNLLP